MKTVEIHSANRALAESFLKGKTFCITGTCEIERKYYEDYIRQYGGTVENRVTEETSYVLAGDNAFDIRSAKIQKAIELDTEIISQWTFLSLSGMRILVTTYENEPKAPRQRINYNNQPIPRHIGSARHSLSGKTFCITGTLSKGRKQFLFFIKKNGGVLKNNLSDGVNYLIAGYDAAIPETAKLHEARSKNIEVIDEKQFLDLAGIQDIYLS